MDLIGMTNLQEARLAREAEICYVTIAMVTDYDCWHQEEAPVTVETLIGYLNQNSENAQHLVKEIVQIVPGKVDCACQHALENAILTPAEHIPAETKVKLELIIGKYI